MSVDREKHKLGESELNSKSELQEIGESATWTLSSAKSGNGVEQLFDGSPDTFWQSDSAGTHHITAQFSKKLKIQYVCMLLRATLDESYTPQKVIIKVGSIWNDMQEVKTIEFDQPEGWQVVELLDDEKQPIRGSMLQIFISTNYRNGKDTHVRGIRVYSPVSSLPVFSYPELEEVGKTAEQVR